MYFYITSTLAMFGLHFEVDGIGAANLLLSLPSQPSTALKEWHVVSRYAHNGGATNSTLFDVYNAIESGIEK